ncbi:MAG: SdrD B-like domain-containing protein [Actinomycetota bacterium]|nr:SdrD B-like domain-containing protein [Actinomycetota bacterium]
MNGSTFEEAGRPRRGFRALLAGVLLATTLVTTAALPAPVALAEGTVQLLGKTVDPVSSLATPRAPGDVLTYTISYRCSGLNLADNCSGSLLRDTLPTFIDIYGNANQLEFVSATFLTQDDWVFDNVSGVTPTAVATWTAAPPDGANCTPDGNGANVGLCAGDSGAIILKLRVPFGIVPSLVTPQTVVNTATVDLGPTPDGTPDGTPVSATSYINATTPSSGLTKSGPADRLLKASGTDPVTYTISICAEPNSTLHPAYTVTDTLPVGFTLDHTVPVTTSSTPGTPSTTGPLVLGTGGTLTWEVDETNLPPRDPDSGCLRITVVGNFVNADAGGDASNVFDAVKTNTVSAVGHPDVGLDVPLGPADTSLVLRRPITTFTPSKNTGGNYYVDASPPDNEVHYFLGASNTSEVGAAPFSTATLTDGPLPDSFTLTTINTGTWDGAGDSSVTAVIETSPDNSIWTVVSTNPNEVLTHGVGPIDFTGVRYVRWTFSSTPSAIGPGWNTSGLELVGIIDGSAIDPVLPNCVGLTGLQDGVVGEQNRGLSCASVEVEATPKPHPSITKTAPAALEPGQTVSYSVVVANDSDATEVLVNPQVTDCVPDSDHLTVSNIAGVNWTVETLTPAGCTPTAPNTAGSGTLIVLQYTGTLAPGAAAPTITYDVRADAYGDTPGPTLPGDYTNTAVVTYENGSPFDHCVQAGCDASATVRVPVIAQLQSQKLVKGALDREFNKAGTTTPGGQVIWRLTVQNVGNVEVEETKIVDIFSFIGDRGVQVNTRRGSEYVPYLVSPITVPAPTTAGTWTVKYSTSSNPCRPEVVGPEVGCDAPNWTSTPNLLALSTYKSILLEYSGRIGIGESLTFDYNQVTPVIDPTYDTPNESADPWDLLDTCTIPNSQHPWVPADAVNFPGDSILDATRTQAAAWVDSNNDGIQQTLEGGPTCPRASNSFAYGVHVPTDQRNGLPDPGRLGAEPPKVDLHVAALPLINSIGNRVWEDVDNDGIQDLTELGIPNIRVELYDGVGLLATTFTDPNGWYMFDDRPYGTDYFVRFYMPDSLGYTSPKDVTGFPLDQAATNDNTDDDSDIPLAPSGNDLVLGNYYDTTTITLGDALNAVPETDPTWDAGIWIPYPAITLKKYVNTNDAQTAPGVYIERDAPVTWTYDIVNTGNTYLKTVTLTDLVNTANAPDPVPSCDWPASSDPATPAGVLSRGETVSCTASSTAIMGQYTNTATVVGTPTLDDGVTAITGKTGVPSTVTATDPANYFGVEYDLALAKISSAPTVAVDGTVSWTIRVVNQGNVPSRAFTVTDVVPAGMYVTATTPATTTNSRTLALPPDPAVTPPTTTLTWNVAALAAGASTDITITTRVNDIRLRAFRNWAEITSDSSAFYNTHDWDSTPGGTVGLDDGAGVGTGPDDEVIDITSLVGIPDTILPDLPTHNGDEDDNDYAEVTGDLVYDLALAKIVDSATATNGSTITWRFRVFNQGNVPAENGGPTGVQFTDNLPTGLDHVSSRLYRSTISGGAEVVGACALDVNGYTVTCSAPNIAAGDWVEVRIVTGIAGSPYNNLSTAPWRNWAEVSADDAASYSGGEWGTVADRDSTPDTNVARNSGTQNDQYVSITTTGTSYAGGAVSNPAVDDDDNDDANVTNSGIYDLALTKRVNDTVMQYDQTVTFTITVRNQGNLPSHGYTITDHVPAGLTPVEPIPNGGAYDSGTGLITWIQPNLAASTNTSVTYQATIGDITLRPFRNLAEITADSAVDYGLVDRDSDPAVTENDAADYPAIGAAEGTGIDNLLITEAGSDGAADEDDEDIADVNVDMRYDLALVKVVDATDLALNGPDTGTATFTVTVQNQGTVPSNGFVVTDWVPTGIEPVLLSITDGGVWDSLGRTITWTMPNMNPGVGTLTRSYTVTISDITQRPYRNIAEITADSAADYSTLTQTVTDADSTIDVVPNTTNDGTYPALLSPPGTGIDNLVITDAGNDPNSVADEDDADIADLTYPLVYDLALVKVNDGPAVVQYDATIPFTITVQNQGVVDSNEFTFVDTIPDGLTLVDADGGTVVGNTISWTITNLAPGATDTRTITFTINDITKRPYRNFAEITADSADVYDAPDPAAPPALLVDVEDADSTPGTDPDTAAYPTLLEVPVPGDGIDNVLITEAGTETYGAPAGFEEDDADIADVGVDVVYDLALSKVAGASTMLPSGSVVFTITVVNQGTVASGNYQITDSLPEGMVASAASDGGDVTTPGVVTWDLTASLAPGESRQFTITALISDITKRPFKNIAEISLDSADDYDVGGIDVTAVIDVEDVDSFYDATTDNDNSGSGNGTDGYGTYENPTNDVTATGGAEGPGTGGEDDADVAFVDAPVLYDLALVKTGPAAFDGAGNAVFTISIKNQGNVPSGNYIVRDEVPTGLAVVSVGNGGSAVGGVVTWNLSGLAAGATTSVTLTLRVSDFATRPWVNYAEISLDDADIYDTAGYELVADGDVEDDDSTPNVDMTDDVLVDQIMLPTEQLNDPFTDEDDHDIAPITVTIDYDLALVKVLPGGQSFLLGSNIAFRIDVMNQGNVDSGPVTVVDSIPDGLTFVSADNGGIPADRTVSWDFTNLTPGQIVSLTLVVRMDNIGLSSYINYAEIAADGADQYDTPSNIEDADSAPDADLSNDLLIDTDDVTIDQISGDEDDHDRALLDPAKVISDNLAPPRIPLAGGNAAPFMEAAWAMVLLGAVAALVGRRRRLRQI